MFLGLLNLRGSDIDFNPVFFAYVVVTTEQVYFFVDHNKLPATYKEHFADNDISITILPYNEITEQLNELVRRTNKSIYIYGTLFIRGCLGI